MVSQGRVLEGLSARPYEVKCYRRFDDTLYHCVMRGWRPKILGHQRSELNKFERSNVWWDTTAVLTSAQHALAALQSEPPDPRASANIHGRHNRSRAGREML